MTDQEKKDRLRKVLNTLTYPAHCNGCDEWGCDPEVEEEEFDVDDETLERVWQEIRSWDEEK